MADSPTKAVAPSSATTSTAARSGRSAVAPAVQKYILSPEECKELFGSAEPLASLDVYLIDRCGEADPVKIAASAMTSDGVSFSFAFEGDTLASSSPSSDYYRISNASVNITLTVRLASILGEIRAMILPGTVTEENGKTKQVIDRTILRRRPKSFVLLAVAEGQTPNPEEATGGSLLFGNTTLDYSQNLDLNYNPTDPIEIPVNFTARFTRGVEGVLAEIYY